MVESRRDSTPGVTLLDAADLHYFNEGTHSRLYEKLGAHPLRLGERQGTYFAVWAPNAAYVYVMGDINGWHKDSHPLQPRGQSGMWEGFLAGVEVGSPYKYHIVIPQPSTKVTVTQQVLPGSTVTTPRAVW
jgi:1,4-alpha-glucan branching enzyme